MLRARTKLPQTIPATKNETARRPAKPPPNHHQTTKKTHRQKKRPQKTAPIFTKTNRKPTAKMAPYSHFPKNLSFHFPKFKTSRSANAKCKKGKTHTEKVRQRRNANIQHFKNRRKKGKMLRRKITKTKKPERTQTQTKQKGEKTRTPNKTRFTAKIAYLFLEIARQSDKSAFARGARPQDSSAKKKGIFGKPKNGFAEIREANEISYFYQNERHSSRLLWQPRLPRSGGVAQ